MPSPLPRLCVSSLGASELAGLGERERGQSAGGEDKSGREAIEPILAVLEGGAEWAISRVLNDGEGEGMGEIEVDEEFMGGRNEGGSVKPRYIDCAAQHQNTKGGSRAITSCD